MPRGVSSGSSRHHDPADDGGLGEVAAVGPDTAVPIDDAGASLELQVPLGTDAVGNDQVGTGVLDQLDPGRVGVAVVAAPVGQQGDGVDRPSAVNLAVTCELVGLAVLVHRVAADQH